MQDNILICGVNWVGDAVMTLPAIAALQKAFPESSISLLALPWVAPLFEHSPHIDEVIVFEDRGVRGTFGLARKLRAREFSKAILLPNSFRSALVAYLARIPERIGYSRDGRGPLLTMPVPYKNEDRAMHHTHYYLELLMRAGIQAGPSDPWLHLTLEERLKGREALAALRRPVIGINPGAAFGSAKQWLPERFADVARKVTRELDGSVVVFGGPKEIGIAEEILSHCGDVDRERLLSFAGRTTLRELMALVSECDVLLTNDSGPMHIGYALRTPLVAIFGPTDPELTGPVGPGNIVLKKDIPCSPCFKRTCERENLKCMRAITADEVFESIRRLLPEGKAVFLDRDGTLCTDADYLNTWDDFRVFPEINALGSLKKLGFKRIGVTNQSGIARGIVDEGFVKEVNAWFMEHHGFEDFYYCPHHPDEHCACRKPEPGMLLKARVEHRVDLRRSYVVGDKEADMLLAKAAGAKGVLVLTGKQAGSPSADFIARDLEEATRQIAADV